MTSRKGLSPSALRWLLVPLLSPLIAAMLTSCVTTTASEEIDEAAFCSVAEPFAWSKKDTDETIIQAKAHNCVGLNLRCQKFEAVFHMKLEDARAECKPKHLFMAY